MDYHVPSIYHFIVERIAKKKTTVRLSIPPVQTDSQRHGLIFGLVHIDAATPGSETLAETILEQAKKAYTIIAGSIDADPATLFEQALQRTNTTIAAFIEREGISIDVQKVNIVIGLISQREIHIGHVGHVPLYLFQPLTKNDYRIIDVLQVSRTPITAPHPLKLFSQIISGRLGPGDIMCVATPTLLDYFSIDKIKQLITGATTVADGVNDVKSLLYDPAIKNTFGMITITLHKLPQPGGDVTNLNQDFDYQEAAARDSVRELSRTEQSTERLLEPALIPNVRKSIQTISQQIGQRLSNLRQRAATPSLQRVASTDYRLAIITFRERVSVLFKKIWQSIRAQKKSIALQPSDFLTESQQHFRQTMHTAFDRPVRSFRGLPKLSRRSLTAAGTIALILIVSIFFINHQRARAEQRQTVAAAMSTIESTVNDAEANLIYRNEDQARQSLQASKTELQRLQPVDTEQKNRLNSLIAHIDERLLALRHVITIDQPVIVANVETLDAQANLSPTFAIVNGMAYVHNRHNGSLYSIDTAKRTITMLSTGPQPALEAMIPTSNKHLLLLGSQAFRLAIDTETVVPANIKIPATGVISSAVSYASRVYITDQAGGSIYRFGWSSDDTTYQSIKAISAPAATTATDLAVDGALYVLHDNTTISKVFNNKPAVFATPTIDPPISTLTKLFTTIDTKQVYLLEPKNHRIIVTSKEGAFITQYDLPNTKSLSDLVADEAHQTIYVLDGNQLLSIPLQPVK